MRQATNSSFSGLGPQAQRAALRRFAHLTIALSLVATLMACSNPTQDSTASEASQPALTVATVSPKSQHVPLTMSANGTVSAWQEAIIGPELNGLRVTELLVNVGDRVRKGQALATFAAESVANDLRLAEAALSEASAAAAEAKADGERARNLRGSGSLSEQRLQQLLTQEQSALARLESTQAQLAAQQLRMRQTTLRAPDDGIVSARSAAVGSVPAQGAEMFRLIRQGRLEWRGEFTAAELEQIRPGQKVSITSPTGKEWPGQVRTLAPTLDAQSRRGVAYVDIGKPEGKDAPPIRPGAYVRGDLSVGTRQAWVVPQSAVIARDGFHMVFVVSPDLHVSQRRVQIGSLQGDQQEILSGVKPEDRLVASGGAFLTDGDTVKLAPVPTSDPAEQAQRAPR